MRTPVSHLRANPRTGSLGTCRPRYALQFSGMASPHRRVVPPAAERWSPEQAAEFAARRDFRLLQLLSTDARATATARRLGYFGIGSHFGAKRRNQLQSSTGQPLQSGQPEPACAVDPTSTSKQRRSAACAAAHRAAQAAATVAAAATAAAAAEPAAVAPADTVGAPPATAGEAPAAASVHTAEKAASDCSMTSEEAEAALALLRPELAKAPASPSRPARVERALLQHASDTLASRREHAPGGRPSGKGRGRRRSGGR